MTSKKHIFIFAGSHNQATLFARSRNLHPSSWTYLYRSDSLRGVSEQYFIRIGTWANKRNCSDIETMLKRRKMIEVSDVRGKE